MKYMLLIYGPTGGDWSEEAVQAEMNSYWEYEKAVAIDPECWRALFHVGKISLHFGWVGDSVDYVRARQAGLLLPTRDVPHPTLALR